ncbi:anhydro-N-acetylmuramic acid kinase [Burkholderia multivorans]|nr:anhydro-N-acetylmuramic acid kinase [Burkholderia multivorans]MDR8782202.1 Anhydro-N-acetylmuramic acid kinase [Burkholderia multivorans]MDR8823195.1 Anhydro-N-acetylmuramic acid kinase [Burkholderia multivorans]PRF09371.1 anhydro-N-acetylmuramic acid kinase [Burkholderia multivorans]PRG65032.1 anhydro-N-acetylmuramic acid kinase [Burkholderia multivorans]
MLQENRNVPQRHPPTAHPADGIYFGLMSGTSMDGVDGVAVRFAAGSAPVVLAQACVGFAQSLRDALFALQQPGDNEIERESLAANAIVARYAVCCHELLRSAGLAPDDVRAIGVHGQTVRHRPERGYTRQLNNPALLAELAHIDVIADFRSRDVAAGGHGAPLAPAFHAKVFGAPGETRVVCNLGGISNITILPADGGDVRGFDCGPANALIDAWATRHLGKPYDDGGKFAARGTVHATLLDTLLDEPYFNAPPPKSTGRDLFNPAWLDAKLAAFAHVAPEDVQATLTALTAVSVAREIARHAPDCRAVFVCGGGARNPVLLDALSRALRDAGVPAAVDTTATLGVPPQQVEALAFAWLAYRFVAREPGNLPAVTGAAGERVLGALYPR